MIKLQLAITPSSRLPSFLDRISAPLQLFNSPNTMGKSQGMFSITISAKRKPGMDEDAYHKYISETHAGHLKHLLVEKKIVDYTMVRFLRNPTQRAD